MNGAKVDALCSVVHRSVVEKEGRDWARRLREVVPRQQYEVRIPSVFVRGGRELRRGNAGYYSSGGGVNDRSEGTVSSRAVLEDGADGSQSRSYAKGRHGRPLRRRRDSQSPSFSLLPYVPADSREQMKQLAKQRVGKKRLKERSIGRVTIPTSAFFTVLGGQEGKKKGGSSS